MGGRLRRRGYTLIEILAAFFIMTIILTLVTGIFVENGRQRAAALGMMRESLSAAAALDQIAQDLEGAVFLANKAGRRPDENPWQFFAEGVGEAGAVAIRFATQNAPAANPVQHSASWVEVAYFLGENDWSDEEAEGEYVLWRWISPRPPAEASRIFPEPGDPGTMRLALGVLEFGVRFLDGEGEWVDEWDSAFQASTSPLPAAAEITLRLTREARAGETDDGALTVPGPLHQRRVPIAMPPIDVVELIELGLDDAEEGSDCYTVSQCLEEGDASWYQTELDEDCGGDEELCDLLADQNNTCWSEIESGYPALAAKAPETCSP